MTRVRNRQRTVKATAGLVEEATDNSGSEEEVKESRGLTQCSENEGKMEEICDLDNGKGFSKKGNRKGKVKESESKVSEKERESNDVEEGGEGDFKGNVKKGRKKRKGKKESDNEEKVKEENAEDDEKGFSSVVKGKKKVKVVETEVENREEGELCEKSKVGLVKKEERGVARKEGGKSRKAKQEADAEEEEEKEVENGKGGKSDGKRKDKRTEKRGNKEGKFKNQEVDNEDGKEIGELGVEGGKKVKFVENGEGYGDESEGLAKKKDGKKGTELGNQEVKSEEWKVIEGDVEENGGPLKKKLRRAEIINALDEAVLGEKNIKSRKKSGASESRKKKGVSESDGLESDKKSEMGDVNNEKKGTKLGNDEVDSEAGKENGGDMGENGVPLKKRLRRAGKKVNYAEVDNALDEAVLGEKHGKSRKKNGASESGKKKGVWESDGLENETKSENGDVNNRKKKKNQKRKNKQEEKENTKGEGDSLMMSSGTGYGLMTWKKQVEQGSKSKRTSQVTNSL